MVNKIGAEKVILISPAPVFEKQQMARTNDRMKKYAQTVKKVAKHEGTSYVPLFETLVEKNIQKYVIDDGLHFNKFGYEELSELVLRKIKTLTAITFPKKQLSP
ncbi:GDSL-type esterase/lipase family protein [Fictibacillus phosphorivorans]|uniref:GDSL-type esterase/lipase family protein n=2 Tax=Fictibacillus TaxID=1329200 RepID=UPI0035E58147